MPMIFDEPVQTTPPAADDQKAQPQAAPAADADAPAQGANGTGTSTETTPLTPALARFHSCRWRAQPEDGMFCTHRDVLPMAGKSGFSADSWCPDCQYFKVRRAPRKREYNSY
jgi:hypothetical protein